MKPLDRTLMHLYGNGLDDATVESVYGAKIFQDAITFNSTTNILPVIGSGNDGWFLSVSDSDLGIMTWVQAPGGALPSQTGQDGRFLQTRLTGGPGTETPSWVDISQVPPQSTNIDPNIGTANKFLSSDGTTANWAVVHALPDQFVSGDPSIDTRGKFLGSDGTAASWALVDALPPRTSGTHGQVLLSNGTDANWAQTIPVYTPGFLIAAADTTTVPLMVKAGTSQTYNLQEWQNTSGTPRSAVDSDGYAFLLTINFALGLGIPMTTGLDKTNWYMVMRDCKLVEAWILAKSGPTVTSSLAINIEYSNTSGVWHTPTAYYVWDNSTVANQLHIAASSDGSTKSGSTTTFNGGANGAGGGASSLALPKGTWLRLNVTSIGDTVAGQDVTVQLLCLARNLT